jgi:hypothetical protein
MIRRYDFLLDRIAFGVLCVDGMCILAVPVLLAVGPIAGIALAIDGNGDRAFWVWAGSWMAALFAAFLVIVFTLVFWPLASDWITEWQGYAAGFAIGGAGLGVMAFTVFITDWPLAWEIIVPLAGTFLTGFLFPGRLLGLGAHSALPQERDRARSRKSATR